MKSNLIKNETRMNWIAPLIIASIIIIIFGQSIGFNSINYDDPAYVYENEAVSQGVTLHGIKWALTQVGETNLWHPITWLSHMVDVEVFGIDHVGAHHAVNVFWHILCSIGVFFLLKRLTKRDGIALLLAILWAIHPQRVQSLMWISERKDVLSGAFFIWSWWSWEKWRDEKNKNRGWYALSLALFVLAGLSKPSVVPLPAILLMRELFRRRDTFSVKIALKWIKPLLPFVAVSVMVAGLTIYFQRTGGMADVSNTMPLSRRLMLMPVSLWWYLQQTIAPFPGKLWVYPPAGNFHDWIVPSIGFGVFIVLLFKFNRKKYRLVNFGLAVFLLMWLPVSGIVPVSFYFVADRYSYLMQIGLMIAFSEILLRVWYKIKSEKIRKSLTGCAVILVLLLSVISWNRAGYWKNSETLFSHERNINPRSLLAPIQLGLVYEQQNRNEDALALYLESCKIDKESGLARTNAGLVLEKLGRKKEAEKRYREAIKAINLHSEIAFIRLAKIQYEEGDFKRVEDTLNQGLERFPQRVTLLTDLATLALNGYKDPQLALERYNQALKVDPFFANAMQGRGVALLQLGRRDEGRKAIQLLIKHHPERRSLMQFIK